MHRLLEFLLQGLLAVRQLCRSLHRGRPTLQLLLRSA